MKNLQLCDEMKKFRNLLTEKRIPWVDRSNIPSDKPLYCTHFKIHHIDFSVANGYGTGGGYDPATGINTGLLEVHDLYTFELKGHLTADEAMEYITTLAEDVKEKRDNGADLRDIIRTLWIIGRIERRKAAKRKAQNQ